MAANIADSTRKGPTLLSKIEAGTSQVNSVSTLIGDDSIISASDDKTLRVWVRREGNQYWPSVIQSFGAACSVMVCEHAKDRDGGHVVFVGLGNGEIQEYRLSNDLNRFERKRIFQNHTNRVTGLKVLSGRDWILSTSRDKRLQWTCISNGRSLGTYQSTAWCLAVEYDDKWQSAFVAKFNGGISVVKLEENNVQKVTSLRGHSGSVSALTYDPERRLLFSGGFDHTIVVWDIGSQQGKTYELNGHTERITSLSYLPDTKQLLSCAEDRHMWIWDFENMRDEVPSWEKSDRCQMCNAAFFWNFRGMWNDKSLPDKVVVRQHHCRKCGKAVCTKCSDHLTVMPRMGFERPVRLCDDCFPSITTHDREPLAYSVDLKCIVTSISVLHSQNLMVTGDEGKAVHIWDTSQLH